LAHFLLFNPPTRIPKTKQYKRAIPDFRLNVIGQVQHGKKAATRQSRSASSLSKEVRPARAINDFVPIGAPLRGGDDFDPFGVPDLFQHPGQSIYS